MTDNRRDDPLQELDSVARRVREKYADIIDLDPPVSYRHPPMDMSKRAAQFSPFAALTGYGDIIAETDDQARFDAEFGGEHYETPDEDA